MHSIVWPLAIAQTVVWAGTFYLFPAVLPFLETETGWSRSELTLAFTLSLLVSALFSPLSGRLIDGEHGLKVISGGALLSSVSLIILALTGSLWQFYLVWLVIGAAMAFSLYEPCFSILTHHLGATAKPWITRITLVAGLAGTLSFPTVNALADWGGWRAAVVAYAIAIFLIVLPLTVFAVTKLRELHPTQIHNASQTDPTGYYQTPPGHVFWALGIGFTALALSHGMIITHILPLLAENGITTSAAVLAASTIGPMQVVGRIIMMLTERRASTYASSVACFTGLFVGALVLWSAGASLWLVFGFVALHGASWGTLSILRPVLTRELMGGKGFGLISGRLSGLMLGGAAIAPLAGSLLWQAGGYQLMLAVNVGLTLMALLVLLSLRKAV